MTGTVAEEIVDGQAMERLAIDSRVSRLLGDFIEKTSGAHRPRTDDAQCPRTDDSQ
jgi:hypothetical protein